MSMWKWILVFTPLKQNTSIFITCFGLLFINTNAKRVFFSIIRFHDETQSQTKFDKLVIWKMELDMDLDTTPMLAGHDKGKTVQMHEWVVYLISTAYEFTARPFSLTSRRFQKWSHFCFSVPIYLFVWLSFFFSFCLFISFCSFLFLAVSPLWSSLSLMKKDKSRLFHHGISTNCTFTNSL